MAPGANAPGSWIDFRDCLALSTSLDYWLRWLVMKINMILEPKVLSSSPGFHNLFKNCCCPSLCLHIGLVKPYLQVDSRVRLPRYTWEGVLKCICGLSSLFHQFVLLVALCSAWSLIARYYHSAHWPKSVDLFLYVVYYIFYVGFYHDW